MKVLIIGAHGNVGQRLVSLMQEDDNFTPVAFVRKEEQVEGFKDKGVEARLGDLMKNNVSEIQERMDGIDAIVFAAGAGGSSDANTILTDLDGAVKVMEAAEAAGIKRFVMLSAYKAGQRDEWSPDLIPYYAAKMYADRELERTDLDYTIIRPGMLANDEGTGKIQFVADDDPRPDDVTTQRWDVAKVLLTVLPKESTYHQHYNFVSGGTPIDDAF